MTPQSQVFDISGSTKNIYKVQIYFGCKKYSVTVLMPEYGLKNMM